MDNAGWAGALEQTGLAQAIQESLTAFPLLEVAHVWAIALVVGSIFLFDLRLLGVASKSYPLDRLMRTVLPVTVGAFVFAVLTDFLMFVSRATSYLGNPVFLIKLGLLLAAGVNMALFHAWSHRRVAGWSVGQHVPPAARLAGLCSLVLWSAILTAGRFVGFT
ncbi:DUF6644 family protein [Tsuneonella sp. HG222]